MARVTWSYVYATIFGPTGTSPCALRGGCHTANAGGFRCGITKEACYDGMVAAGFIMPGVLASQSVLVDPNSSPLCGTLRGSMPIGSPCVTDDQIQTIKAWLATGAGDD